MIRKEPDVYCQVKNNSCKRSLTSWDTQSGFKHVHWQPQYNVLNKERAVWCLFAAVDKPTRQSYDRVVALTKRVTINSDGESSRNIWISKLLRKRERCYIANVRNIKCSTMDNEQNNKYVSESKSLKDKAGRSSY